MKLLIITQAVDKRDTTLGFFHRWIDEFSGRVEKVTVMALRVGEYGLPDNVTVCPIRDREGMSKAAIASRFIRLIRREKDNYDAVFVHMNQEYVLLGGLFWKSSGKKIFFWRNHPHGDMLTRIAVMMSDKIFCTSKHSFTARYAKTVLMPAGIDTALFKKNPGVLMKKNSLLMFGRIGPIKRIESAIDALAALRLKGVSVTLSVVGDALPKDAGYVEALRDRAEIAGCGDLVNFEPGVAFENAPAVYQSHEIFLNFTPSGSFDKTVMEALACGTKVLVSNESMKNLLPESSITSGDAADVAKKIEMLLSFDERQSASYEEESREVVRRQSLTVLMNKLSAIISSK